MSDLQDLIHTNARIAYYQGALHNQEAIIRELKETIPEGEQLEKLIELVQGKIEWK